MSWQGAAWLGWQDCCVYWAFLSSDLLAPLAPQRTPENCLEHSCDSPGAGIGVIFCLACPGHVQLPEGCLLPDFGLFGPLCMLLASFILPCVLLRAVRPAPPSLQGQGAVRECYGSSETKSIWLFSEASAVGKGSCLSIAMCAELGDCLSLASAWEGKMCAEAVSQQAHRLPSPLPHCCCFSY